MTKVVLQSTGERTVLSINVANQMGIHGKTVTLMPSSHYTKINFKWVTDMNVKGKIIKLPEGSIREYHDNLR